MRAGEKKKSGSRSASRKRAPPERVERSGAAVVLFDGDGRIVFASPPAQEALERLGFGHPTNLADFPPQLQAALRASAPLGGSEVSCAEVPQPGVWGVQLPIEQLDPEWLRGMAEAEQMAAVGQLAATVAQEIGGPNTSIQVTVDHLLESPAGRSEELQGPLRQILSQTARITRLTRQLIAVADPGRARLTSVEVNEIVESACELMQSSFSAREIALSADLRAGPVQAVADRNHLLQALVNLLLNARAALQAWTGERKVRVRTETNGERVYLHVEDSGPGVPQEDSSRIFLPFVSTTGGSGMGLYLTRQILVEQGGGIRVLPRNDMGGATFTVYLDKAKDD